ncbi:sialidase family protein [Streptomyces sp. NPDC051940]|uniref:sialidase family protein n=1 Tax=Streptomyces sp. NPDC051940 TaxID=3155675 RepID=UPI00342993CC
MPPHRARTRTALAVAGVLGLLPLGGGQAAAATPEFSETALFTAGTGGYACYRIPVVVRARNGDLLAFAEGRVAGCGDKGDIDIVLRRSLDGGVTWQPQQVVLAGNGDTRGNPAPVVDRDSGRISLLSTWNPGTDDTDRVPYLQYSTDDGASWGAATNMRTVLSRPEWDRWYATGPNAGIQLANGPHAGRLVVGGNHEGTDGRVGAHLMYSDDGGLNWRIGADDTRTGTSLKPQELSLFEKADGAVVAQARDENGTDAGNRAFATSTDQGASFDAPFRTDPALQSPVVQGSTVNHGGRVLLSAPAHPYSREVMTVRASSDEGATWETWDQGRVVNWGWSAYSSLVELAADRVGLLYETGSANPYGGIRWARFNDAYLDQPNGTPPGFPPPPAPGPTTPDSSTYGNKGYVRGTSSLKPGRFGNSVYLNNADDHIDARIEVPYAGSLDLGAGDFTWTGWFKYGRTDARHTIAWAYRYGSGTAKPQIWLRAEPADHRIRAYLQTDQGGVEVKTAQAYNDNTFHFVSLQRTGGRLTLAVDGTAVSATAPAGSVTIGKEFGIDGYHFGESLAGTDRFHGYLDDMRVYNRALTAAELSSIRTSNAGVTSGLRLRLPLDVIG